MFMRYGIRSMTMDDIARELGVSKKTLYQDFQDKKSLIAEVIDFDLAETKALIDQVHLPGMKAIQEIFLLNSRIHFIRSRYSTTFHYDLKRYFPQHHQRWVDSKRRTIYRHITENLKKGKKEGVYRREIKESIIGKLYVTKLEMLESTDFISGFESLSSEFIKEMFFYHIYGICNQSGIIEFLDWNSRIKNPQAFKL